MLDEGVVLLGGALGQRLEPVCVMRHTVFLGPLLHAGGHGVGHRAVERRAIVYHVGEAGVHVLGQILVHLGACEHVLAEILRRALNGRFNVERLFLESLLDHTES